MQLTEDELCGVFADGVRDSRTFRNWLLARTKLAEHVGECRLLDHEQFTIRPRKKWWRHWWCHVDGLPISRETDIFMVFEVSSTGQRFALHVENKRNSYRFNPGQAAAYAVRARGMLNRAEYLSHSDFQTLLLAPMEFRARYRSEADLFDVFISYEEVGEFLPQFASFNAYGRGINAPFKSP